MSQIDREEICWHIEQLMIHSGLMVDRPKINHIVDDALAQYDDSEMGSWWRLILEVSRSLSLNCRVVDCSAKQLRELVTNDSNIILCDPSSNRLISVLNMVNGKYEIRENSAKPIRRNVRPGELIKRLGSENVTSPIRCVLYGSQLTASTMGVSNTRSSKPLDRLIGLLKPELSDVGIIVVFAMITGLLALATPLAVETLVSTVAFGRFLQPVVILALILFAFLSFSAALRALQTYVVEIIQRRLFARIAADLAFRFPRVEISSLDGKYGREMANRFFEIVTVQKVTAQLLLDGISLILGTLIGMAVLAFYHPWLLGFDLILLASIALIIFVLGRKAVESSIKESKTKYRMAAWLQSLLSAETTFRHSNAAEFALAKADQMSYDYLKARKAHFRILMRQILFALGLQAIASTVLLGLGGWLVITGQLTLGQLVASELIVTVIVGSFAKLGKHMESYYDLLASVDKLGALFDLKVERQDGLIHYSSSGSVEVKAVNVSSKLADNHFSLNKFSFHLKSGDRLVLRADELNGTGLLLDLLFGMREPTEGHVTIDGIDPRDFRPDVLRKHVQLVRDMEMFLGTVAENLHLGRPEVSQHSMREVLENIGLLDDILRLPDGLETTLVENGYPLSQDQITKLVLARALLGSPSLLLIDRTLDTFSDQDAVNIAKEIMDKRHPWTVVLVTNRNSLMNLGNQFLPNFDSPADSDQELIHV
ncbi:peptidase domain-containing ABC transporter [Rubinisphaera italica]|uniref:Putative ABC transporter ATP-binding protein n=1 Tax=Rubinisphaera italica TaxID=2527969 RepID=A0A5C5XD04_9PLAN|nr:ABC transporter ATP-binding protein [Rubinisphaera italica]TWT60499.1 putative ABC transporter ATP-binding protein [Rubinisphaera italica]